MNGIRHDGWHFDHCERGPFAAVAAPENAFGRKNMELSEYPTFTVIMRGYTPDQADAIM
ncbi:2-dehydro-3-deoxyphosphogluconate aldolase, partial [Lacticaseibacillus paracasei]